MNKPTISSELNNSQDTPLSSGTYRMKCPKFEGKENEDYDVWYDDVKAFFELNTFSEASEVKIINANLGGEARKFMHGVDVSQYDTVRKLNILLRDAFSDRVDWYNVLTNWNQMPDEKIKT